MSETKRPVPEGNLTQEEQLQLLQETGNVPTEDDEGEVLRSLYGPPDADGNYTGSPLYADEDDDDDDTDDRDPDPRDVP